jgi:hypothetical protein
MKNITETVALGTLASVFGAMIAWAAAAAWDWGGLSAAAGFAAAGAFFVAAFLTEKQHARAHEQLVNRCADAAIREVAALKTLLGIAQDPGGTPADGVAPGAQGSHGEISPKAALAVRADQADHDREQLALAIARLAQHSDVASHMIGRCLVLLASHAEVTSAAVGLPAHPGIRTAAELIRDTLRLSGTPEVAAATLRFLSSGVTVEAFLHSLDDARHELPARVVQPEPNRRESDGSAQTGD